MSLGISFLISIYILLFSHLTVDKDFSQNVKVGSYIVFGLIGIVYVYARIMA